MEFHHSLHYPVAKKGLGPLKNDIENKTFETIKEKYNIDCGDYLFITAQTKGILMIAASAIES